MGTDKKYRNKVSSLYKGGSYEDTKTLEEDEIESYYAGLDETSVNYHNNEKYGISKIDISFYGDDKLKHTWLQCEQGHDYISRLFFTNFYSCPRCFYSYQENFYKLKWNPIDSKYDNPFAIKTASLLMQEGFLYWKCNGCKDAWSADSLAPFYKNLPVYDEEKRIFRDSVVGVKELYGICPNCNVGRLIPGFNDCETVYGDILYSWNDEKNNCIDLKKTIANKYIGIADSCDHFLQVEKEFMLYLYEKHTYIAEIGIQQFRNSKEPYKTFRGDSKIAHHGFWFRCINGHEWIEEKWYNHRGYCKDPSCEIPTDLEGSKFYAGLDFDKIFKEFSPKNGPILANSEFIIDERRRGTNTLSFRNYVKNLGRTFIWECSTNSNHVWSSTLWKRLKNPECRQCFPTGTSIIEQDFLNELKIHIPDLIGDKHWVPGFYWPKDRGGQKMMPDMVSYANQLIIEYDGYAYHSGIKSKKSQEDEFTKDLVKTDAYISQGWKVLRIRNHPLEFLESREGLFQVKHTRQGARGTKKYDHAIEETLNQIMSIKELLK